MEGEKGEQGEGCDGEQGPGLFEDIEHYCTPSVDFNAEVVGNERKIGEVFLEMAVFFVVGHIWSEGGNGDEALDKGGGVCRRDVVEVRAAGELKDGLAKLVCLGDVVFIEALV